MKHPSVSPEPSLGQVRGHHDRHHDRSLETTRSRAAAPTSTPMLTLGQSPAWNLST